MKKGYTCFDYDDEQRKTLEDLYEQTFPKKSDSFIGKDLPQNVSANITIVNVEKNKGIAVGETKFGQSVVIDVNKEIKGMQKLGYPEIEIEAGQVIEVVIQKDKSGTFNGSLCAGFEKSLKRELNKAIKDENCAFRVKVISVCNGGFMVNLSGIQCFLPGSLAAANRIMNFHDYVGKEINVMIEVYDQKRDIFVVSFKKYLKKIIESRVQELSFSKKYEGSVTGVSSNSLFVEWDEIFTGMINFEETERDKLNNYKTGDKVNFYVIDIKNPQRVIISLTEPNQKMQKIQELKDSSISENGESSELKTHRGEITKLKTFGAFIKLENGLTGLIEREKLKFTIDQYEVGQQIDCIISSVDTSNLKIQLVEKK